MIDIAETVNKIRQLAGPCRLKGNDDERRAMLERICRRHRLSPVYVGELD